MEQNQQTDITKSQERLQQLNYALQCHLGEEGTTYDQNLLLFSADLIDECRATTACGTTVTLTRDDRGGVVADAPVSVLLEYESASGAFTRVEGVGWVVMRVPSVDERTQRRLDQELRSNALYFLPEWARTAVLLAFEAREIADRFPTRAKKAPAKKVARRQASAADEVAAMLEELPDENVEDSFDEAFRNMTLAQAELDRAEADLAAARSVHQEAAKALLRAAKPAA